MNDTQKDKFQFVEYSAEAAERIGYSDYSYWKSVFQNFFRRNPPLSWRVYSSPW